VAAPRAPWPPALVAARELRAALYALFAAVAAGEPAPAAALERLRDVHAEGAAAARLDRRDGGYALAWPADEPRRVGYAVAADAVALLADPGALARLKRCPGRDCGWLFLDTSGRRRWCSMGTCGSREKMRRMYARRRAEA
jgi:predicted RNA-binding Zn ribbon-like protein